ncbi:hypothetical protein [Vulgatibacter incomptus]|uniref:Uncharacterized protein n=1 Tax=Vulgatibacter incomptus TaxID=1391653 RepID=A0A0K1PIJ9_9BACT|nr:hypothetical protein [Vulgatibacter incomptus]AKU93211.1 hypothetical protein AKJ08_3598 [Vulgatibacter incomptus]
MPHVIEIRRGPTVEYPRICPYCESRPTGTSIEHEYKSLKEWGPFGPIYESSYFRLPACTSCVQLLRRMKISSWVLGVGPFAAVIVAAIWAPNLESIAWWSMLGIPLGIAVWLWRASRRRRFRVGKVSQALYSYCSHSARYARDFAELNGGTKPRWRWLIFRWR